jgi:hypothetical protein
MYFANKDGTDKRTPPHLMQEYVTFMKLEKKFYICVIASEYLTPMIYMERASEKDTVSGIIRVFFKEDDLLDYVTMLLARENLEEDELKKVRLSVDDIAAYTKKINDSQIKSGKNGVKSVVSAIEGDYLYDIDVLWTSQAEVMV